MTISTIRLDGIAQVSPGILCPIGDYTRAQVELGLLAGEEPDAARLLGRELAQTLRVSGRLFLAEEERSAE